MKDDESCDDNQILRPSNQSPTYLWLIRLVLMLLTLTYIGLAIQLTLCFYENDERMLSTEEVLQFSSFPPRLAQFLQTAAE